MIGTTSGLMAKVLWQSRASKYVATSSRKNAVASTMARPREWMISKIMSETTGTTLSKYFPSQQQALSPQQPHPVRTGIAIMSTIKVNPKNADVPAMLPLAAVIWASSARCSARNSRSCTTQSYLYEEDGSVRISTFCTI